MTARSTTLDNNSILKIRQLYESGIDAVLMVLESYYKDLARFEREIMPGCGI